MLKYNFYTTCAKHSIFENYRYDYDSSADMSLLCFVKYNLQKKVETIEINEVHFKSKRNGVTMYSETLPLGCGFIELINLDLNTVEKMVQRICGSKIFANGVTLGEYIDTAPKKYNGSLNVTEIPLETVKKENFISGARSIRNIRETIANSICAIASLHPFLVRYSQAANAEWLHELYGLENDTDIKIYLSSLTETEKKKYDYFEYAHRKWYSFINCIIAVIQMIRNDCAIIEKYRQIADICLNVSHSDTWGDMPLSLRLYMANMYFGVNVNGSNAVSQFRVSIPDKPNRAISHEEEFKQSEIRHFRESPFEAGNILYLPPSPSDITKLRNIYEDCTVSLEEVIGADTLNDVCLCSFQNMVKNDVCVKECGNCGRYFIPINRSDTIYCDGISPQNSAKTCKRYGAEKQYQGSLKSDEVSSKYRQTYMKIQMMAKRNPDIAEHKIRYEKFKRLSKQWKAAVKKGTKTREEFLSWLETY